MHKTFSHRLKALEVLSLGRVGSDLARRYPPADLYRIARLALDYALIYDFGSAGFRAHAANYADNPQYRDILAQRIAALDLDLSFDDLGALCRWLGARPAEERGQALAIDDTADLTDDEILAEACYGLGEGRALTGWDNGAFRRTFANPAWGVRHWQRIAERAQAIADERQIVLFPMTPTEIREAIDLIEAGRVLVRTRSPLSEFSHHSCISPPSDARDWKDLFERSTRLAGALDSMLWQTRRQTGDPGGLCATPMAVLETLSLMLGDDELEPASRRLPRCAAPDQR